MRCGSAELDRRLRPGACAASVAFAVLATLVGVPSAAGKVFVGREHAALNAGATEQLLHAAGSEQRFARELAEYSLEWNGLRSVNDRADSVVERWPDHVRQKLASDQRGVRLEGALAFLFSGNRMPELYSALDAAGRKAPEDPVLQLAKESTVDGRRKDDLRRAALAKVTRAGAEERDAVLLVLAAVGRRSDVPLISQQSIEGNLVTRVIAAHATLRILRREPRIFSVADWTVVTLYTLGTLSIGVYYFRRQTTREEYFLGNRSMRPFMVGISLFATLFSTLSYISIPGEIIQHGPITLLTALAVLPLAYLAAGWWLIPAIMKLPITSAYELLESRLGTSARIMAAVIFIATRIMWLSTLLFVTSSVLIRILSFEPRMVWLMAVAVGGVSLTYTFMGGIRAVILTDTVQFFILLAGILLPIAFITMHFGGVRAWWSMDWAVHWDRQPLFSLSPLIRVTIVGGLIDGLLWWICICGSDQLAIQRYLATRDVRSARRAFFYNTAAAAFVFVLLGVLGLALMAFYGANPYYLPDGGALTRDGDKLFPHYFSNLLPTGIAGLVVAGVLSAAMSSLSSGISSITTVFCCDILERSDSAGKRPVPVGLRGTRLLSLAFGVAAVVGSLFVSIVPGNLTEVMVKTFGLFTGPLFALFFLGMFVPFANGFGAIAAAAYGFIAALLVSYWDILAGSPPFSFQWVLGVSVVVAILSGCGLSLLSHHLRTRPARRWLKLVCIAIGGAALCSGLLVWR